MLLSVCDHLPFNFILLVCLSNFIFMVLFGGLCLQSCALSMCFVKGDFRCSSPVHVGISKGKERDGNLCISMLQLTDKCTFVLDVQLSLDQLWWWVPFAIRLGHSNLITCLTSFFWKKNPVRLPKKRKKKSSLVSYGRKWFWNFLSDSNNKKKSASFKNVLCKCDSINYRKLSLL